MIDEKTIEKIAHLARLKISPVEEKNFENHFKKILDYFQSLQKINTENVEPMVTPHNIEINLREDGVRKSITTEEVLSNGPDVKDGLFKVPPVV